MADDGLVLNFAFNDGPLQAKTAVKGGSWRARRKVQLMHRSVQKPREERLTTEAPFGPVVKRQKISTDDHVPSPDGHQKVESRRSFGHDARQASQNAKGGQKQVISSLFSYNPKSVIEKEEKVEAEAPIEPSNAPLTAEQLNFTSLGLSPALATHLTSKMNIIAPTSVQKASLEVLLKDDTDAFLQAETGSGKTLAYVLPIVQRLMELSAQLKETGTGLHRHSGLFAIVLTPTRELSKQVSVVLENVLRCAHWLVAGSVIGGEKKQSEKARLRKGINILVATPGRLADHLDHTETLDVSKVRWLVLDEGDRLMELGFENDLAKIITKLDNRMKHGGLEELPSKRINILCSATMRMDVQKLGEMSLKDAIHIQADSRAQAEHRTGDGEESAFAAPAQLKQSFVTAPAKLRLVTLYALLKRSFARKGATSKAIVFISCADSVDFHFEVLARQGKSEKLEPQPADDSDKESMDESPPKANEKRPLEHKANAKDSSEPTKTWAACPSIGSDPDLQPYVYRLHGSLPQALRTSTLKSFAQSPNPAVLLCTDVASRGLDLPDIDLVVEYDPSFSKEDHLHRIGRTARAGKDGRATIFLMPGCEEGYVDVLKEERKDSGASVSRHTAEDHLRKAFGLQQKGEPLSNWTDQATAWQLEVERWTLADPRVLELARRGYQSHIRAYATHVAAERTMFDIKELHLGHLAKAFGLRDRPASINVPGLRHAASKVKQDRRAAGAGKRKSTRVSARDATTTGGNTAPLGKRKAVDLDVPEAGTGMSIGEGAKLMRAKARMAAAGASEFNLA